ncbi:MAG: hypothetical protein OXE86_15785 [Alphaproteobacteria bacterium]|nr:hypothetical protein [Alphaproteobacteria bacterium]
MESLCRLVKPMSLCAVCFFLFACRADEVEISFDVDDIPSIANGTDSVIEFQAGFSQFGELDDNAKSNIDRLEDILNEYVDVEEFEIDSRDSKFIVDIEGSIPVTNNELSTDAFYLHIEPSDIFDGYYKIQIKAGAKFASMKERMSNVNIMLAPERFHPTKFKIKGKGYDIIALGTRVSGEPHLIYRKDNVQKRTTLYFSQGIYEDIGPAVFVKLRN